MNSVPRLGLVGVRQRVADLQCLGTHSLVSLLSRGGFLEEGWRLVRQEGSVLDTLTYLADLIFEALRRASFLLVDALKELIASFKLLDLVIELLVALLALRYSSLLAEVELHRVERLFQEFLGAFDPRDVVPVVLVG